MPIQRLELYKSTKTLNLELTILVFVILLRFTSSLVLVNRDAVKSIN